MNPDAARQTFVSIWNFLRRAPVREAEATLYEETRHVVDHRRRFWADLREGQREAAAACLESERVLKQRPAV
jgi:hypothetical protein